MTPMDSQEFDQVDHLNQFLSGSKIAFCRQVTPGQHYRHTGTLLRGKNNEPNVILEVNDAGPDDDEVTLHQTTVHVYWKESNLKGPTISIKGEYLHTRGLDMAKILYRYCRTANLPISYKFMTLNCQLPTKRDAFGSPEHQSSLAYVIDFFRLPKDGVPVHIQREVPVFRHICDFVYCNVLKRSAGLLLASVAG